MDRLEQLKRENEKLAVDSIVLNEILDVVDAWNMDARRYPDLRMIEILKIINEREDEPVPLCPDECVEQIEKAAFVQAFNPDEQRTLQEIRMKPLTR